MVYRKLLFNCLLLIYFLSPLSSLKAQENTADTLFSDSLSKTQIRKLERKRWRQKVKENHSRFFFKGNYVFGRIQTNISSELFGGILVANLKLEEHLKLPDQQNFLTGSFLGRLTPNSGIYAAYYGLNRKYSTVTNLDYILLRDTIPAGTNSEVYCNTQMISAGYVLSVLKKPESFLGVYFNLFIMKLNTGVYSDFQNIDSKIEGLIPFPNFGLVAAFQLKDWLYLGGNIGFFALKIQSLDESLYDLSVNLTFKPYKWLGISLSYQEFNVRVLSPQVNYDVVVDYKYQGPSFGLLLCF